MPFLAVAAIFERPAVRVATEAGGTSPVLSLVGCDDRAIAAARVDFSDDAGDAATATSASDGSVAAEAGFAVRHIRVTIGAKNVAAQRDGSRLIACALGAISRVTVATGSARSLHELPVAASSLDRATISRSPSLTTDSLLRQLPGFDAVRSNGAFTNYGQLRVSLNGSGNDRGALLVDDVPGQDGFGGQVDWQAYAPSEIVSAELLRGPGSALYGSGAIGGTLALSTFAPPARGAPANGHLSYTLGTRELRDLSARYAANVAGRLSASASLDERHEAYLDVPKDQGAPIDVAAIATETTTHLKLRYEVGAGGAVSFGTIQAYDDQEEGRPNDRFGRTFGQYDLSYDTPVGAGAFHIGTYARDSAIVNVADQLPAQPGVLRYTQNVPIFESGVAARYVGPDAPLQLQAVADARDVRGESMQTGPTGLLQTDANGRQTSAGLGLQASYRRPRFELLGGLRGDEIALESASIRSVNAGTTNLTYPASRTDGALSPRVAARFDVTPALAVRASAGAAFRVPFLNELIRGFQIGSVAYAPNANLVPERSDSIGAGADFSLHGGRLAIDATRTYVNDAILFLRQSATLNQRENVGATRTDGITAEFRSNVARCVDLRVFGTAQHARVLAGPVSGVGKALAFVPSAIAGTGADVRSGSSVLDVDVAYAGPAYADDVQQSPLGTAVVTSLRLSTDVHGTTVSAFADNATDAIYRSSIDRYAPPSTIGLRVSLPFGGRSGETSARCP